MNVRARKHEPVVAASIKRWRFALVLLVLSALLMTIVVRLFLLHTVEQPFLFEQGEKRTVRSESLPAARGMITDRNGKPLAVSTPVYDLSINPQVINLQHIPAIAKALGMKANPLQKRVRNAGDAGRVFMPLKRQVAPHVLAKIKALKVKGLFAEQTFKRYYPSGESTAHVLGLVNIDGHGQEGLELAYDEYLRGQDGQRKVVKDLYGNVVQPLAVHAQPKPGNNLQLTLDVRLQYIVYRELKAVVKAHRATWGSAVLLDARTGEVLAMANQPSYNPNNRASINAKKMRNRAVVDVIEPGSTMKPFTVAAALNSGKVSAHTKIDTAPGYVRIKHKTIRDHRNYGVLDVTGIITKSSNVGANKLAKKVGAEQLWQFFGDAGVGQATSLGYPGESVGSLPYPAQLDSLRLATLSYGYGMTVTPLQLAQAYTSFSHDGCRLQARILLHLNDSQPCTQVMSKSVARTMLNILETVTTEKGTGSRAASSNYRVGGKTGTAHKVSRKGYSDNTYRSIFVGISPLSNPDLVLAIVIDEPKGREYYGGEVAAPVFERVMEQVLPLRQAIPDRKTKPLNIAARAW